MIFFNEGDLKIHTDDQNEKFASQFLVGKNVFDCAQHVCGPAHQHSHTLDLVISFGINPVNLHTNS